MKNFRLYPFIGLIACLLMILSYSADFRLGIGGLLVHPYLLFIGLATLLVGIPILNMERRTLIFILMFLILFGYHSLLNENPYQEILKAGAALFTFLVLYQTVKAKKDIQYISLGLIMVSVFLSVKIILEGADSESRLAGINVLESIGNKNAQSLYILPGFFFLILNLVRSDTLFKRLFWVGLASIIILATALTANRSGWIGIILICLFGIVHSWRYYSRSYVFPLLILGLLSSWLITSYAEDVVERKVSITQEGYISDYGRQLLIVNSFRVGFENPFIGIGKDNLHREMAKSLVVKTDQVDTHNIFGYLIGSSGIFTLISFLLFLYFMQKPKITISNEHREILLWFLILFLIRGLFTREVLYSPTFFAGIGILLANFRMEEYATIKRILQNY